MPGNKPLPKAKSRAQQAFFAIAAHEPQKLRGARPMKMSQKEMRSIASTPTAGLPRRAKKRR